MHVPLKKKNRIVQCDVTSRCDLACSGCTRALAQHRKPDMTPEQFERAVLASKDWIIRESGVFGVFGGNPCLSQHFEDYGQILAAHLPERCRGLWTNALHGKGEIVRRYWGPKSYFNLNVHNVQRAADEFRRELPYARVHGIGRPSKHASIFIAAQDFLDEDELWRRVEQCSYDIHWSAIIMQEAPDWQTLGGYSCEIAGTHARTNGRALGVPVEPGWLDRMEDAFRHQYEFACRRCGGCLNLEGIDDNLDTDQYSASNANIVQLTISRRRPLQRVDALPDHDRHKPVDYLYRKN